MKSEAAGDKVTPLDTYDLDLLRRVIEFANSATIWDVHDIQRIQNIQDLLRSQVESGMTGRYNPETHCIVDRKDMRRTMSRMAGPSGGMELKRIEDAYTDMNRWLSPSPETPEL